MTYPYPPNLPTGVSNDVIPTLGDLRRDFSTETPFLKAITDHFVKELERGWCLDGVDPDSQTG